MNCPCEKGAWDGGGGCVPDRPMCCRKLSIRIKCTRIQHKKIFQNSVLNIPQAFYFRSYNNVTHTDLRIM